MQTITARPLFPPHPAAPALVSAEHVHDAVTRALIAERDAKSLRSRCRTLLRALNDSVSVSRPLATVRGVAMVSRVTVAARVAESLGEVPVIRFSRNEAGEIDGLELALLEREDAGSSPLSLSPVEFGGMAVVND